jgi:hypothetical protein
MCWTYVLLDELQVLYILRTVVGEFYTGEKCRDEVVVGWVDAMFDLAVSHPGQVTRFAVEGIRRDLGSWRNSEPAVGKRNVGRCEGGAGERQLQVRGYHGGQFADFDA